MTCPGTYRVPLSWMTGITPIFQVMRQILEDPEDKETRIWVLNTNKTEQDILLREEIESLIAEFSKDRVQVYNTLSTVPEGWKEGSGRMNEKMMREHLPAPSPTGLILTCGPDGMISGAVKPGMRALGWNPDESLVIF